MRHVTATFALLMLHHKKATFRQLFYRHKIKISLFIFHFTAPVLIFVPFFIAIATKEMMFFIGKKILTTAMLYRYSKDTF